MKLTKSNLIVQLAYSHQKHGLKLETLKKKKVSELKDIWEKNRGW